MTKKENSSQVKFISWSPSVVNEKPSVIFAVKLTLRSYTVTVTARLVPADMNGKVYKYESSHENRVCIFIAITNTPTHST